MIMYRLFVAIDIPEEVKQAVACIRMDIPGVRWVQTEQLHLTLRFIGDADESLYCSVKDSLARIAASPFTIALSGVGHFPAGNRGRVIWVGMDEKEELLHLQSQVESALQEAGVAPELRPFSPHITLARIREPRPGLTLPLENARHGFSTPSFPVSRFYLYSSLLTGSGAIHKREATYQLAHS